MKKETDNTCSCKGSCSPTDSNGLSRRAFMKTTIAGAAIASGLHSLPVMAGPFEENEYLKIIAEDKKLDPDWLRSLYARGEKQVYTDPEALKHIGMPIGGLFAGTVYLSGDGRLWLWDIFNRDQEGIRPRKVSYKGGEVPTRNGANYIDPAEIDSPFEQGFGLRLDIDGSTRDIPLNGEGFEKVTFNGQYPMATVDFESADLPVKATLKAYSPHIPLNLEDSSLPATIMGYTITNTSEKEMEVDVYGKMQNPICMETRDEVEGELMNSVVDDFRNFLLLNYNARGVEGDDRIYDQRDHGSMALAVLSRENYCYANTEEGKGRDTTFAKLDEKIVGTVGTTFKLVPGESKTVNFAIAWNFPNFKSPDWGHHYAERFRSSLQVMRHVSKNFERLSTETEKWVETWYDSSLPYWLLDRTMANTSTLATTTCYQLEDGRFWAWEGIGCCNGTCTHVWHYAQAPGRIFPEIERITRERTDFGIGQHEDGGIGMRTGLTKSNHPAHDGQCGRILGAYREHQMSVDDAFLKRLWPNVKKAMEYMIRLDGNKDGMIEGAQPNTLDAAWYGKVSFLQSLYIAALKASQMMATEMGDAEFATECGDIAAKGAKTIEELYNGEYFVQIEDPAHKDKVGVGPGCYIDQVFGQSWAYQVGLGQIFDKDKQLSALKALWKYNFVPDVGPFRDNFKQGRWYATAGDAGLLMCTWPKGGQNPNFKKHWQYQYFNECMTGFEWQVSSHMVHEGMLKEGLAIARSIHDRYDASLRNPYNEIECSDHYSRAMASYGTFVSICGFEYHGPKGHMAFSPRLTPEDFRSSFITAQGWGTFSQQRSGKTQTETLTLNYGELSLNQVSFELPAGEKANSVQLKVDGTSTETGHSMTENRVLISLAEALTIQADQKIEIEISL